jgi:hypothetical protein
MLKNTHKWYAMQIIGEMYIKCGLVLLKIYGLQLSKLVLVVASQKILVSTLRKWKMVFLHSKIENSYGQHCLPFQDAHVCPFWEENNKLCHAHGHNIGRLP